MNNEQTFKPGDVVRLKSGGPRMTVAYLVDIHQKEVGAQGLAAGARCAWFKPSGEMCAEGIGLPMLEHADPAPDEQPSGRTMEVELACGFDEDDYAGEYAVAASNARGAYPDSWVDENIDGGKPLVRHKVRIPVPDWFDLEATKR